MDRLHKIFSWMEDHLVGSAVVIFLILCPLVVFLSFDRYSDPGFRDNVLAEAHGLLVELLVVGVLLLSLDKHRERRSELARYNDTIDEHRGWKSDHAATRLKGLVQRLNARNFTSIDLHHCFMKRVNLKGANLTGALLQQADLGEAYLRNAVFDKAQMDMAYLGHADLRSASFRDADMRLVRFQHSDLTGADFRGANLSRARFNQATLINADLRGADLSNATLVGVDLARANLKGVKNLKFDELLKVKSLEYAHMDDSVLVKVKALRPNLLLKYGR
jgi:BTB/POZ domain-containing protein KCTD9